MPTPEMVPFRLTRDLVHALGPLGVEVGFVSTAEIVLCAFSSGSEIILTLLEVELLVQFPFHFLASRLDLPAISACSRCVHK